MLSGRGILQPPSHNIKLENHDMPLGGRITKGKAFVINQLMISTKIATCPTTYV